MPNSRQGQNALLPEGIGHFCISRVGHFFIQGLVSHPQPCYARLMTNYTMQGLSFDRYTPEASTHCKAPLHAHRVAFHYGVQAGLIIRPQDRQNDLDFKVGVVGHYVEQSMLKGTEVVLSEQGIRWVESNGETYGILAWCTDPDCGTSN